MTTALIVGGILAAMLGGFGLGVLAMYRMSKPNRDYVRLRLSYVKNEPPDRGE